MLRSLQARTFARTSRREMRALSSTISLSSTRTPNAHLDLDETFQTLLRDADLSLLRQKSRRTPGSNSPNKPRRELEVYPSDALARDDYMSAAELDSKEFESEERSGRKSPAALFGSQRIGAVVLPLELQNAISRLITDSDKPLLREDAKRLFLDETGDSAKWDSVYDVKYKSWQQHARHAERDGTAFASVALPAHYSAIYSVFDHLKQRLGADWSFERVIDWGSGTGSGLWALSHSFQNSPPTGTEDADPQVSKSALSSYIGIDKRVGLTAIGKRLVQNTDIGNVNVTWQKSFNENDKSPRSEGGNILALSAFLLSSLPTPVARKQMAKEMWESGADVMVLIDHNSTAGFECIAEAREWFLRWGERELQDSATEDWPIRGSHVVAPCPHDHACPLFRAGPSRVVCGFSQRLQRPDFTRKTKHAKSGHEDVGYSYVVIRRGLRPQRPESKVGRIGDVGRREQEKFAEAHTSMMELSLDSDGESVEHHPPVHSPADPEVPPSEPTVVGPSPDLEASLISEAYHWPRLVFPPLKRSGHIILDSCTSEGKIMRVTIPKSQGKQPFYDARKSSWGDIFPHDPKNPPQERFQPGKSAQPVEGQHIGKRSMKHGHGDKHDYTKLAESLKEKRRKLIKKENRLSQEYQERFGEEYSV